MGSGEYRIAGALTLLLFCTVTRADAPPDAALRAVIADGSALAEQRQELEADQRQLLTRKQALDALAADIARRQTAMNGQVDAHNQEVSTQQQALAKSRAECNKSNISGGNQLNDCNESIRKLNRKTEEVDDANLMMQAQQDQADLDYAVYNLDVADWNYREEETVTQLNVIYQATNAWMDAGYTFLVSDGFQLGVRHTGNERYCSGDALPSGHITEQQLVKGADYLLACFRRVEKAQRQGVAHGGG